MIKMKKLATTALAGLFALGLGGTAYSGTMFIKDLNAKLAKYQAEKIKVFKATREDSEKFDSLINRLGLCIPCFPTNSRWYADIAPQIYSVEVYDIAGNKKPDCRDYNVLKDKDGKILAVPNFVLGSGDTEDLIVWADIKPKIDDASKKRLQERIRFLLQNSSTDEQCRLITDENYRHDRLGEEYDRIACNISEAHLGAYTSSEFFDMYPELEKIGSVVSKRSSETISREEAREEVSKLTQSLEEKGFEFGVYSAHLVSQMMSTLTKDQQEKVVKKLLFPKLE